jgi:hypothetical protein
MQEETMKTDNSDFTRIVQNSTTEQEQYLRQLHIWLGVGCGGGAISMLSFAANLTDKNKAFSFIQISLWAFLFGILAAGASILLAAEAAGQKGQHFAAAHNREDINSAIRGIKEIISSPESLADKMNKTRNELIEKSKEQHQIAERSWTLHKRYKIARILSLSASCISFVIGFGWPLLKFSLLGAMPQ